MEIETIMKKDVLFTSDEDAVLESKRRAMKLLSEYDYSPTERGLDIIYDTSIRQKAWLYNLFQKSPYYNGNGQIVLPKQLMLRSINVTQIVEFVEWAQTKLTDLKTLTTDEITKWLKVFEKITPSLYSTESGIVTEDDIKSIEEIEEEKPIPNSIELAEKFSIARGQKWSRVISKIGKLTGLDKFTDIQEVTHNGETEKKDYGWNYKFALFADAINPKKVENTLVLSINPIDFWTMSFGDSWASCHTIDKSNRRRKGGSHNYSGCYSGGTESYMLDDSSIVVYYVDEGKRSDTPYELTDKVKRCMFYLGEDKLIQSRVYPDGRDGGDSGLAKTMREIVQYVIAQLLNTPNLWKNAKGIEDCTAMIKSEGVHYRDYQYYEDCNVSYLRRINGDLNTKKITVGAYPICPACGDKHYSEDWITCESCRGDVYCASCDASIYADDAIYCPDNGNYYCDSECAENDYVYYCEDSDDYHTEDNCRQDERNGYWYYYTDDGVWVGDSWYHSYESAEEAGARYCEDSEEWSFDWYETEDGYFVYDKDNCELETVDEYLYYFERNFDGEYTEDTEEAVENVYQAEIDGLVWQDALTKRIYSMNTPYYEAESGDRYLSVAGARIAGEAVPLDNVIIVRSLINPAMEMGGVR